MVCKMNVGGLILLLIIAACVVALIIIARKRIEAEENARYEAEPDSSSDAGKPAAKNKEDCQHLLQVTIYEYRCTSKKRLCSLCDGENDVLATQCCICGCRLN